MSSSRDVFPFDSGPTMYSRFSAVIPGTLSGHGGRKCQARLSSSSAAGPKRPGSSPRSASTPSRFSRCSTSSETNGRCPVLTRRIPGTYRDRQASANAAASSSRPCSAANRRTAAATPVRQSTTVPNTSNNTAFTAWAVDTGVNATVPASHHQMRPQLPPPGRPPRQPPSKAAIQVVSAEASDAIAWRVSAETPAPLSSGHAARYPSRGGAGRVRVASCVGYRDPH